MKITERLNGKKILIWGYGREGKSTEDFLKSHCSVESIEIFVGKREEIDEEKYDYIIKSPGIFVKHYGKNYTSQTELFLEEFAAQTIGVTGTKGKSTTSSMIYQTLRACRGDNVLLVGNIGLPCLDYYDKIDSDTVIVYEMSCHQLSHLKFSPHVAVFLNLYEDHLDYYETLENYFGTKKNITTHQSENDYFFCGDNVPEISTKAKKEVISYDMPALFDMKLKGTHNQFNARFVYKICTEVYGCDKDEVKNAIESFNGLAHRMENIGTVNGVEYYNDSISTIPQATIQAARSIKNTKTVIIGGMDRHINYDILVDFIKNNQQYNYILSYESGKRIYDEVSALSCCRYVNDLEESVKLAKEITPEGGACVFSPAAASYGYFKNFEERGKAYTRLVLGESEN